jgi:DNA-binding NarL/FixJ family response regulator
VIADAQPASLAGISSSLGDGHFEVVAVAASAAELIAVTTRHQPDVCLIDADLPGDAIAATTRITRELPRSAVVLLALHRGDSQMFDAVRAGAAGYLLKDMDPERLRFAIRGVTEGEAALPRKLVTRLMEEFRRRGHRRPVSGTDGAAVGLTSREWDVMELIADGASTRAAAQALNISDVTVRRHVSAVAQKLGAPDRATAVDLVRRDSLG